MYIDLRSSTTLSFLDYDLPPFVLSPYHSLTPVLQPAGIERDDLTKVYLEA
jgi:hypothetical protein